MLLSFSNIPANLALYTFSVCFGAVYGVTFGMLIAQVQIYYGLSDSTMSLLLLVEVGASILFIPLVNHFQLCFGSKVTAFLGILAFSAYFAISSISTNIYYFVVGFSLLLPVFRIACSSDCVGRLTGKTGTRCGRTPEPYWA